MSFLSSLTGGDIGKATTKALKDNRNLITGFQTTGNSIIDTGEGKSATALNSAISAYQPWAKIGGEALGTYSDALGLNGAEGNARATGAFQTGPGYEFALDQGTKAALRGASAAGMLSSGNTLDELTKVGQGYANQEYGSWLDRLNGLQGEGLQAASGQAAGFGNLADLYQGTADDRLGLESGITQGLIGNNNDMAKVKEQQAQAKGSFFGNLLSGGISLGTKAMTGGLF